VESDFGLGITNYGKIWKEEGKFIWEKVNVLSNVIPYTQCNSPKPYVQRLKKSASKKPIGI